MYRNLFFLMLTLLPVFSIAQSLIPYSEMEEKSDICNHIHGLKSAEAESDNPLLDAYDITFTKIDIESGNSSDYIRGYAYIEAKVTADQLSNFVIELAQNMRIDSIQFNGNKVQYSRSGAEINIGINNPLSKEEVFSATIYYRGYGNDDSDYAGGLHHTASSTFNYDHLTYSFTQPFGANLWFPCKQKMNDKIDSLHVFVTTYASEKVSSNGVLTNVVELPGNKRRYEWKTKYPIAYYLVAFNIFDYTEYNFYTHPEGFSDSIFIQNFLVDQAHVNAMKNEIDRTHDAMNLYCNLFGMYPFSDEKYGHTIWGKGFGMEHQTMTSMPYNIDFRRLSHELSHQWFGNSVACGSWQDIWLNEGFATYFDYLAIKTIISEQAGKDRMNYYHSKAMDYVNGSVYVPDAAAHLESRIFNYSLSYCKGGAVLGMLRNELQDDELFWQVLRNYLEKFKGGFARTRDFQQVVEETSGKDFAYFFDQWIYGEGFPTLYGDWYQRDGKLTMIVKEQTSSTNTTSLFKMQVPYQLNFEDGSDSTIVLFQESRNQTFEIPLDKAVKSIYIDTENKILNKNLGMTKITPTSVNTNELLDCKVYPNPFSDEISVLTPQSGVDSKLRIYNAGGILVLEQILVSMNESIDVSTLKSGMYVVEISSEKGFFRQKLIKQ
ncbi:M1 family aminopeptidase [Maribellus sediminis]|uniref:M1 family aminopeptidase n=1 Tax=Maribellus sediminis TaxID=2696285 RepID=UPI001430C357|nr:M1 family aminopeptidase [Maribellus sediminis]